MNSKDLHNIQEAYFNVYEATGRDEMLAANIARAGALKPTTSSTTPLRPATTSSLPKKPTGPVTQTPKPTGGIVSKVDSTLRDVAGRIGGEIGAQQGRGKFGNVLGIPERLGRNRGTQQGQQMYDRAKETVGNLLKQDYEYDVFDIILEHLVTEGYADTNENALVIMTNMSEEWRQSILEAEVLAMKGGVPGSVKVRPKLSIPGTNIGVGPNKPVPGTFTTTTPAQREKIKQGDTHIDRGLYKQPRQGAGPTSDERIRYNRQAIQTGTKPMPR